MATTTVEEIYERHIKPLPPAEQLRLVAMTAYDLAEQFAEPVEKPEGAMEVNDDEPDLDVGTAR
jgi:hypothetical protein